MSRSFFGRATATYKPRQKNYPRQRGVYYGQIFKKKIMSSKHSQTSRAFLERQLRTLTSRNKALQALCNRCRCEGYAEAEHEENLRVLLEILLQKKAEMEAAKTDAETETCGYVQTENRQSACGPKRRLL
jgi:inhibitor of KinA sporulation pathway (predicted exonuclease)